MGGYRGIYFSEDCSYRDDVDYEWSRRDNPCAREYYNYQRFAKRNAFVSDLGITGKRGDDHSLFVAVTKLHTAERVSGVEVELFNYQLQSIVKVGTGGDGTVVFEDLREMPFLAVAKKGESKGHHRMADGNALSLSRFDVAGVEAQRGHKGYLYGERGVRRPGDSLYLTFVLQDVLNKLPENHPVTLELTDPQGRLDQRHVRTTSVNGTYAFRCATGPEAPTGVWLCYSLVHAERKGMMIMAVMYTFLPAVDMANSLEEKLRFRILIGF